MYCDGNTSSPPPKSHAHNISAIKDIYLGKLSRALIAHLLAPLRTEIIKPAMLKKCSARAPYCIAEAD